MVRTLDCATKGGKKTALARKHVRVYPQKPKQLLDLHVDKTDGRSNKNAAFYKLELKKCRVFANWMVRLFKKQTI